jgi:uncharacterized protein YdeI (YjbR/CyaY-like superfamily)
MEQARCRQDSPPSTTGGRDRVELLAFGDAAQWEAWLAEHCASAAEAWLKIARKGTGQVSVTTAEALDVALCYGWIDSQRRSHDESWFLQRYSPRRRGSSWSRVNVERVEALLAAGRMRAPGLAEVEAAKADGRWDAAYESQRTAAVPPDLAAALAGDEPARAFFESLGRSDRYAVILRLLKARGETARAAELRRMVALLRAGRRVG